MSRTFTKLFSSITESTVWCEPAHTRLVWITMLAMADHAGRVWGSIPGLANRARVPLEDCEAAIQTFLAPDSYSRTKDHEGRRVESIDGGWRLLNHEKYRKLRDDESIKESKRRYINERREAERVEKDIYCRTQSTTVDRSRANAEAEAEAEKARAKAISSPAATRFAEFWNAYPVKKGKSAALRTWQRKRLDALADRILADVLARKTSDRQWLDGYVPHASTYVSQAGWEDAIEPPKLKLAAVGGYTPLPGER